MEEVNLSSIPLQKCSVMDRVDMKANEIHVYPDSYDAILKTIESVFLKSELLLKCKLEFERLVKIELSDEQKSSEISQNDLNVNLIFTGAIKSGRSSIINMILNSKVMPINVLGSSCCVKIYHPKCASKLISVGINDWDGWELDKTSDVEIEDLPKRIEEIQQGLLKTSIGKGRKLSKRLHVQIPHWFLKNINIYKCAPIDGIYSFDEPFDLIEKSKNVVLLHVIDASNGLMEWDRTFLSKIQFKFSRTPIFFIINHIDVQYEILVRDRCIRFINSPEKSNPVIGESESDQTSNDETLSEKFPYNEESIIKQQNNLIEKSKKQITKLGFALGKGHSIYVTSLSVREILKSMNKSERSEKYHWDMLNEFFVKLNDYLNTGMKKMLITSSLQLKCQINGVVDAMLCHIKYPNVLSQGVTSDIYMQEIKKAEKTIAESFSTALRNIEKQTSKIVKEQLKNNEQKIFETLPILNTEDPNEIVNMMKPIVLKKSEQILINKSEKFDINREIDSIMEKENVHLKELFKKLCRSETSKYFISYIFSLFKVLKNTFYYPLIVTFPEEIFYGNTKWYIDFLRIATRKLRGFPFKVKEIVHQMIEDINVEPLIRTRLSALENIHKDIQFFTKRYQETYRIARNWTLGSDDIFKKLVMVDFIIQVIERSFQKSQYNISTKDLNKLPLFWGDFYEIEKDDEYIYKVINIQSFTSLSGAISGLCFKKIFQGNRYIFSYKFTRLLSDGICVLSFSRMYCDLHMAVKNKMPWSLNSIYIIIFHLLHAIKYLIQQYNYIQIDLLPENIILEMKNSDVGKCKLLPHIEPKNSLNYSVRSDSCRKFSNKLSGITFQLGMVLSWIITNDLDICSEMYEHPIDENLEENFKKTIRDKMLPELRGYDIDETCIDFLFHSDKFDIVDTLFREWEKYQTGSERYAEVL